jgi:hypothetical protein
MSELRIENPEKPTGSHGDLLAGFSGFSILNSDI